MSLPTSLVACCCKCRSNQSKTTDYIGEIEYENNAIKRIRTKNGYIENNNYYFYVRDHSGSNALTADYQGAIAQHTHYYPFGASMSISTNQGFQPYKFSDKELSMEHGLNLYDFHARTYDPGTGRFLSIDPMAEKYYSISPYAYCLNNPLRYVDPTGMEPEDEDHSGFSFSKWVHNLFSINYNPQKPQESKEKLEQQREKIEQITEVVEATNDMITSVIPGGSIIKAASSAANGQGVDGSDAAFAAMEIVPAAGIVKTGAKVGKTVAKTTSVAKKASKGMPHGDGGRELAKAEKQIEDLRGQFQSATSKEKKQIQNKIKNIRETAQKKDKGETHWRK